MPVAFRRAVDADVESIVSLVGDVSTEKYGHLFEDKTLLLADPKDPWAKSWIAEVDSAVVGIGLATDDWISDVWLRSQVRGCGVGATLLSLLETQIANEGHSKARLRVVEENELAVRFYLKHGWQEAERYPHERWSFTMVNMIKSLR